MPLDPLYFSAPLSTQSWPMPAGDDDGAVPLAIPMTLAAEVPNAEAPSPTFFVAAVVSIPPIQRSLAKAPPPALVSDPPFVAELALVVLEILIPAAEVNPPVVLLVDGVVGTIQSWLAVRSNLAMTVETLLLMPAISTPLAALFAITLIPYAMPDVAKMKLCVLISATVSVEPTRVSAD